jgi:hypothetical protein
MNPNPTDTDGNQLVVDAHYYLDQASPLTQYVGLFGQNLRFKIVNSNPELFVSRSHYVHPVLIQLAGGRRKSKSRSKSKRRKSRKNKSRRR